MQKLLDLLLKHDLVLGGMKKGNDCVGFIRHSENHIFTYYFTVKEDDISVNDFITRYVNTAIESL